MNAIKRLLSRVRTRRDRCPKCGSELITDGEFVWCSQVPARDAATGREVGGCTYGIRFLPVEEHEARKATQAVVVAGQDTGQGDDGILGGG